jgi:hypothetical protein
VVLDFGERHRAAIDKEEKQSLPILAPPLPINFIEERFSGRISPNGGHRRQSGEPLDALSIGVRGARLLFLPVDLRPRSAVLCTPAAPHHGKHAGVGPIQRR